MTSKDFEAALGNAESIITDSKHLLVVKPALGLGTILLQCS